MQIRKSSKRPLDAGEETAAVRVLDSSIRPRWEDNRELANSFYDHVDKTCTRVLMEVEEVESLIQFFWQFYSLRSQDSEDIPPAAVKAMKLNIVLARWGNQYNRYVQERCDLGEKQAYVRNSMKHFINTVLKPEAKQHPERNGKHKHQILDLIISRLKHMWTFVSKNEELSAMFPIIPIGQVVVLSEEQKRALTNDVIPAVLYASTHPHGQLKEPLPSPSETHLNQMLLLPPTETHHPDAVSIGDELTPLEEDDRVVLSADQEQYYQELKQYLIKKDWDLDEMLTVVDSEFCSALDKPYHQDGNLFPLCEELRTLNNSAKKAFFVEVGSGEDQKFLVKNGLLPPYLILEGKIRYLKEGDFDFGNKALFLMGNGHFKSYSDDGISN